MQHNLHDVSDYLHDDEISELIVVKSFDKPSELQLQTFDFVINQLNLQLNQANFN